MRGDYLNWPRLVEDALSKWGSVSVEGPFENIVVSGMGGSGIVGDVVKLLALERLSVPVEVVKSHIVPSYVSTRTLFVSVSYSGNTHETLLATARALEKGARVVAVTSGGLLERLAVERGLPVFKTPVGLLPRVSFPHMLTGVLGVLDSSGLTVASRAEVEEAKRQLEREAGEIAGEASSLAEFAYSRELLVVATHSPLEPLAVRAKSEFNENSKIVVKVDVAPEWMHNDIVGYEKPLFDVYRVVAFYDPDDQAGRGLVEFMVGEHERRGRRVRVLALRGVNKVGKVLYAAMLFGLASVELALKRGLDPAATESIARYKSAAGRIFGTGPLKP